MWYNITLNSTFFVNQMKHVFVLGPVCVGANPAPYRLTRWVMLHGEGAWHSAQCHDNVIVPHTVHA